MHTESLSNAKKIYFFTSLNTALCAIFLFFFSLVKSSQMSPWWHVGLFSSLALSLLVVYLQKEKPHSEEALDQEKEFLKREIERWKEEAKQRRIEKEELLEKMAQAEESVQLKQLRSQFEEKSNLLSQTREELFHAENKIMAIERNAHEEKLCPDLSEIFSLQKELKILDEENSALRSEITLLEELISHIHRA